jgi:hypothetical protein
MRIITERDMRAGLGGAEACVGHAGLVRMVGRAWDWRGHAGLVWVVHGTSAGMQD